MTSSASLNFGSEPICSTIKQGRSASRTCVRVKFLCWRICSYTNIAVSFVYAYGRDSFPRISRCTSVNFKITIRANSCNPPPIVCPIEKLNPSSSRSVSRRGESYFRISICTSAKNFKEFVWRRSPDADFAVSLYYHSFG